MHNTIWFINHPKHSTAQERLCTSELENS